MKTSFGRLALVIGAAAFMANVASAQNISGQIGTVDRSVERFTLLPGPTFLSPGHAPQSTPKIAIRPASEVQTSVPGSWRFVPSYSNPKIQLGTRHFTPSNAQPHMPRPKGAPEIKAGQTGTLKLSNERPGSIQTPETGTGVLSPSNLFRFDATLHPPEEPLKTEAVPGASKK